jgi:hypothetical protein
MTLQKLPKKHKRKLRNRSNGKNEDIDHDQIIPGELYGMFIHIINL